MSTEFQRDGSAILRRDDTGATQVVASGWTPSSLATASNAFFGLAYFKAQKQADLDTLFDANFDLAKFIRGGNSTTVAAAGVGTFLAAITNNYRTLRASIAAAASVAAVTAVDVTAGWPANP